MPTAPCAPARASVRSTRCATRRSNARAAPARRSAGTWARTGSTARTSAKRPAPARIRSPIARSRRVRIASRSGCASNRLCVGTGNPAGPVPLLVFKKPSVNLRELEFTDGAGCPQVPSVQPVTSNATSAPPLAVKSRAPVQGDQFKVRRRSQGGRMKFINRITVLVAVALIAVSAFAQTTANLTGTVTSDGNGLPGVTDTISSPALQGTRTAVTGDGGAYSFSALP